MPFIKDVANKKFNKKRIRAWNVLDVVDSSGLIGGANQTNDEVDKQVNTNANNQDDKLSLRQANNQVADQANKTEYDILNNQINNEVDERVNIKVNNKDNDRDDKLSLRQVNDQVVDLANKTEYDKVNALLNGEVDKQVNTNANNQDDKLNFGQVKSRLKIVEIYYNSLQGAQKEILKKIILLCDNDGKTGVLQQRDFEEFTISIFKTNVVRLIKKGLIKRGLIQKKGRGGYFSFELSKDLMEILKFNQDV